MVFLFTNFVLFPVHSLISPEQLERTFQRPRSKYIRDLVRGLVNGPISIKIPLVLRYVCRRCDGSWKVSSPATKFPGILDTIRRWYKYEGRP